MDTINNQPLQTNPVAQSAPQPAAVPASQPTPAAATPLPTASDETSKGKSNKVVILLVILLLLAVGMIFYAMFAKNQMSNTQKAATNDSSAVTPSPTLAPTLAPEEDLEVNSPEGDLMKLDADVKGL